MNTITRNELKADLSARKGATFATITANTVPAMNKTGNPFWDKANKRWLIRKISRVNGVLNWIYSNAVNRQRAREEQPADENGFVLWFEAKPRKWGERIKGTPFVENKGKTYLELKVERSIQYEYQYLDGQVVANEVVNPYLRQRDDSGRQEVANPVILRDYALANVQQISYGGEHFQVVD